MERERVSVLLAGDAHPLPLGRAPSTRASRLIGALLGATSAFAFAVDYSWISGDFAAGVTAPNPLPPGDTLTIGSGDAKRFVGGSFSNQGHVIWQADAIQGGNSATVFNSGLWGSFSDGNVLSHTFGGQPTFTNSGTFRKSGGVAATTIGGWVFINNAGTLDAQAGKIAFSGGASTFNANSKFRGAGAVSIESNATFSGAFLADNLVFASGTFTGASAVLSGGVAGAGGVVSWTGGDLAGSWEIAAGSRLSASEAVSKRQLGGTVVNNGVVTWSAAAAFQGGNSGTFTNNGLFEVQASASVTHTFGGRNAFVNNASGIVRATGATLTINSISLSSEGGEFNAAAASGIVYGGGVAQFNDGTRFTGAGTHTVSNDARFVGSIQSANLTFAGGAQTGGGVPAGSKAFLQGALAWAGGDLQGDWEINAGSSVDASGSGAKRQVGGTIVNRGTILWNAATSLQGGNSGAFTNHALFEARTSAGITHSFGGKNSFTNTASGIVRASNGATLTIGNVSLLSEGGTFDAAAGSSVLYNGGAVRFNDGTRFTGEGTHLVVNDARFVGTIQTTHVSFGGGTQTGGSGAAGSMALLQGPLGWTSGDLQGNWEVGAGSSVTATGAGSKRQVGGSISNLGTLAWNAATAFQGGNSGSFINHGLFDAQSTATISHAFGGRNTFTNAASGVVRASSGATLTIGGVALVSEAAEFNAASGAGIVYGGGFAQFNDGTRFTGAGTHTFSNDARFVGSVHTANVVFASGTQTGGNGSAGSKGLLQGPLGWSGGDLQGNWEIGAGSTVTASGVAAKRQVGGSVVNNGTLLWNAEAAFQGGNSGEFINNGLVEIATGADVTHNFGGKNGFVNNGRLLKSAGSDSTSLASVALSNPGTIDVRDGAIVLPANFANAGVLTGTGTFELGGTLANAGHVAPGASPGTLTLNGNFAQGAAGFFDVEVASPTSHDFLIVNGTASLNGTLALHCFAACALEVGATIVVLDATGALSGEFALTMTGFARGAVVPIYDRIDNRVLLRVTEALAPVPEPETYAMMLTGLGLIAWAIRRRQRRMR